MSLHFSFKEISHINNIFRSIWFFTYDTKIVYKEIYSDFFLFFSSCQAWYDEFIEYKAIRIVYIC